MLYNITGICHSVHNLGGRGQVRVGSVVRGECLVRRGGGVFRGGGLSGLKGVQVGVDQIGGVWSEDTVNRRSVRILLEVNWHL